MKVKRRCNFTRVATLLLTPHLTQPHQQTLNQTQLTLTLNTITPAPVSRGTCQHKAENQLVAAHEAIARHLATGQASLRLPIKQTTKVYSETHIYGRPSMSPAEPSGTCGMRHRMQCICCYRQAARWLGCIWKYSRSCLLLPPFGACP